MVVYVFLVVVGCVSQSVICLAEGCGQDLLSNGTPKKADASGNPLLTDIGPFFKSEIKRYFNVGSPPSHSIPMCLPSFLGSSNLVWDVHGVG